VMLGRRGAAQGRRGAGTGLTLAEGGGRIGVVVASGQRKKKKARGKRKNEPTCGSSGIFRNMFFYSFSLGVLICAGTFSTRKHESGDLNLRFTVCMFTGSVRDALMGL
jgi:hypothetical protein